MLFLGVLLLVYIYTILVGVSVATFVDSSLTSSLFLLFQGSRGGRLVMIQESFLVAFGELSFGFLNFC